MALLRRGKVEPPDDLEDVAVDALADEADEGEPEGALASYKVIYRGGLPEHPKAKVSGLFFAVNPDEFRISPTKTAKRWWAEDLRIPYVAVRRFEIVGRHVGTAEALLGGLNSRQLNQDNNIHITFDRGGVDTLLRLEMLTGVSVMGQAKKCAELTDRLRTHGILNKFGQRAEAPATSTSTGDIPVQIEALAKLRDAGILSEEEFQSKKTELLSRL